MSLKRWVLGKVNGEAPNLGAPRERRVARALHPPAGVMREPTVGRDRHANRNATSHLGPYAPVVDAIRDALEHFALSQLRLHLAIAEQDRYILTSIEVECEGSEDDRALLRRFIAEFKPEQIKQYLARDVIAALRNASAIDLSQFAGLNAVKDETASEDDESDPYEDLIADLRSAAPGGPVSPYEVSLMGRWSPANVPAQPDGRMGAALARSRAAPPTPLAAPALTLDVEDAAGLRRIEIDAVVPGRRYVVGKDEGCDVVIDGIYASRRHCEMWLDGHTWWIADAGSTNGIRVECNGRVARPQPDATSPLELPAGGCIVLSGQAQGEAAQYPRLTLLPVASERDTTRPSGEAGAMATPIAPRLRASGLTIAAHMRSGACEAQLSKAVLPFLVGRSRSQALVIDGTYAEVSGRHLEIVAVDDSGASVVVHGDNGVTVDGKQYGCGESFRWNAGEKLLLGRPDAAAPGCTLTLTP
ncbi:MAG TPA: FHA domain-containing protein [Casimicrobiaceae bacterium]|nr:FHA domain-containing protein [Casimicrobiaceae bacterium]